MNVVILVKIYNSIILRTFIVNDIGIGEKIPGTKIREYDVVCFCLASKNVF